MRSKLKKITTMKTTIFILTILFAIFTIPVDAQKPKVTFVELGSVNCVPCKKMQPIMKSIEEKYGNQIKVIFYDVWQEDQKKYADQYNVKLIPTQVFLDEKGKEFFRHEGFYPEKEIDKLLTKRGLKPLKKKG